MTIALHTMVKDGRDKLPALFKSVKGFCDKAIILDTGSTDGTQEWLHKQELLPVQLHEEPFVDFGISRTRGMEFCYEQADWILLLDDDMRLKFTKPIEEIKAGLRPEAKVYLMRVDQQVTYWNTRLVSGDRKWKYVGVTHEYLDGGQYAVGLDGVLIEHHYNHGPDKFERDARLLAADIARDPDNARTIFYLAQTFRDQGRDLAAIRYYELRVRMGGWDQEVYFAAYEAARLARDPAAMQRVHQMRPSRAEPAAWLRDFFHSMNQHATADHWENVRLQIPMSTDILFVDQSAYGK